MKCRSCNIALHPLRPEGYGVSSSDSVHPKVCNIAYLDMLSDQKSANGGLVVAIAWFPNFPNLMYVVLVWLLLN